MGEDGGGVFPRPLLRMDAAVQRGLGTRAGGSVIGDSPVIGERMWPGIKMLYD